MNNYKELVAALREEAEAVKAVEWDIPICTSNHIAEAADVIEQLAQLKLVPLKYEDIVSELREETAYPPYADMLMKRAAEAIEQLVKERDEWKTLGQFANKRAEDYREMRRQRDEAIKERDAAIADLTLVGSCGICKHQDYFYHGVRCGDVKCRFEYKNLSGKARIAMRYRICTEAGCCRCGGKKMAGRKACKRCYERKKERYNKNKRS